MHDPRAVPPWNRRRLERHLVRRGSAMVIRWVCFDAMPRDNTPAPPASRYPDNVIAFRPRVVARL